jgi:hypothetical protein
METHSPVDRDQRKQSCNVDMRFNFAVGAIAIAAAIVIVYLIVVAL